jgi:polysaccharide biosynthesis protein PslH
VVAEDFPWPVSNGGGLRLAQVIEVIAGLGETDVFAFVPARRREPCVLPATLEAVRLKTVVRPRPALTVGRRLRWLLSRRLPLELVQEDPAGPRRAFESWRADTYDLVWCSRAASFELLGRPRLGPTIVDLDDLEDQKILTRLATPGIDAGGDETAAPVHRVVARAQAHANAVRWARFQKETAAAVDRVVVCSEVDAQRTGVANAEVVPNGFDPPVHPEGRAEVTQPPTLLLVGSFGYPPNTDAARFLVSDILPRIRARIPGVTVRLVGEPSDAVVLLDRPPEVAVVGRVAAMEPELARADLVVVPLRYGSGTRVKILEAAAHRIPVVSTTVGAEGLGLEDGRHVLIADDADAFAAACVRLLEEPQLRRQLVDEAEKAFLANFQWESIRQRVRALVLRVAGPAAP